MTKSEINILQPNKAKINVTKVGQALVVVSQPDTEVDSHFALLDASREA